MATGTMAQTVKEQLIDLIDTKQAHVGVVGLGYVGLPLLTEFARQGFQSSGAHRIDRGGIGTWLERKQCGLYFNLVELHKQQLASFRFSTWF